MTNKCNNLPSLFFLGEQYLLQGVEWLEPFLSNSTSQQDIECILLITVSQILAGLFLMINIALRIRS